MFDLVRPILENPHDQALRLVCADQLMEQGDPRGEFIVLQCTRGSVPDAARERREREMLEAHGRAWLGNLAQFVDPEGIGLSDHRSSLRFDRGFLSACRHYNVAHTASSRCVGSPWWATVESLRFHVEYRTPVPAARILLHPVMRSLRDVRGIDGEVFRALCTADRPLPFESISTNLWGLTEWSGERDVVQADVRPILAACVGLPQLRRLALGQCDVAELSWLLGSPIAGRLELLALEHDNDYTAGGGMLPHLIALANDTSTSLPTLVLRLNGIEYRLERGSDGRFSTLRATIASIDAPTAYQIAHRVERVRAALQMLGPRSLTALEVRATGLSPADARSLEVMALRFPHVDVRILAVPTEGETVA